ncbi:MAG TPA: hypothetical protein VK030_03780 [Actinomycetales bacterium]|nr:hypothetical protein [Actinomycetales bacterium]
MTYSLTVSSESVNGKITPDETRRAAAENNLKIALFLRRVRWINLVLMGAVLFAGIVAIGALALTAPPRGSTSDVVPFIIVAGVGQLGAFITMFYGISALRTFAGPQAPTTADESLRHWSAQVRRTRLPMLATGAIAGIITLFLTGFSVITVTGAALGIAFILQLVILLSVATRR